jgi:AmmeMemoRadiSam system protein B
MNTPANLRPSPIAGQWYSGDALELSREVDHYIHDAHLPAFEGEVIALIAPHAGHVYSGPVAGYAFKAVFERSFDLVVVVGPMHRPYAQPLLTTGHTAYETPLGAVQVDRQAVDQLDADISASLGFELAHVFRDGEHSLEIELPFLQRSLKGEFKLLPVMVRDQDQRTMRGLGLALAQTLKGRSVLMVASSDLSHFYPAREAEQLDTEILKQIDAFSPDGLYETAQAGKGYACGLGPIAAVLWAAQGLGATSAHVVHYGTSGDITRDNSSVVGYGSAIVTRPV